MDSFWNGVIPAVLLPFTEDLSVDHDAFGSLVARTAATPGVTAVTVNGVAGESATLSSEEQLAVVRTAVQAAGSTPIVASISEESTAVAAEMAVAVVRQGARAVLVQAPGSFARGIGAAPEIALAYFGELGRTGVPLAVFQHQLGSGRSYPTRLLVEIAGVDHVVAVKETIWDVRRYEEDVLALRASHPGLAVLCANDTLILPSIVTAGADGLLLGFATLEPARFVRLLDAVSAGDLGAAMRIESELGPVRRVVYADPPIHYYARLKLALRLLDILPSARMRPPLVAAVGSEAEAVEQALLASGFSLPRLAPAR